MLQRFARRLSRSRPSAFVIAVSIGGATASTILVSAALSGLLTVTIPGVKMDGLIGVFQTMRVNGQHLAWSFPQATELIAGIDDGVLAGVARLPASAELPAGRRTTWLELVTPSYALVAGVAPREGRWFTDAESKGRAPVAVIGDGFCRTAFDADRSCVGRTLVLNSHSFSIIGVLPAGFGGLLATADVWLPITHAVIALPPQSRDTLLTAPAARWVALFGRVGDTAVPALSRTIERIATGFAFDHGWASPDDPPAHYMTYQALPIEDARTDPRIDQAATVIAWANALLISMTILNVGVWLLVEALHRRRAMVIKSMLGASSRRLVVDTLIDMGWLGVTAAISAAGLTAVTVAIIEAVYQSTPSLTFGGVSLSIEALRSAVLAHWAMGGLALAIVSVCGTGAVWVAFRTGTAASLRGTETALKDGGARAVHRIHNAIVACQVSTAVAVLTWIALLSVSYMNLVRAPIGFDPNGTLAVPVVPGVGSRGNGQEDLSVFLQAISRVDGVDLAGRASCLPLSGSCSSALIESVGADDAARTSTVVIPNYVDPDVIEILGLDVLAGRVLQRSEGHHDDTGPVPVLLSATAAERLHLSSDALGQRLRIPGATALDALVVGVVNDVQYSSLNAVRQPAVYIPMRHRWPLTAGVLIRGDAARHGVAPALAAIAHESRNVGAGSVVSLNETAYAATRGQRLQLTLMMLVSAVTLLCAGLGVAALSRSIVQRRRLELAVRFALGAEPRDLRLLILRRTSTSVALGLGAGAMLCVAARPWWEPFMFGVSAADPEIVFGCALGIGIGSVATVLVSARIGSLSAWELLRRDAT